MRVGVEGGQAHGALECMRGPGRLITVEGLDGAGKTTLVDGLAARLPAAVACCASRAASRSSERIRDARQGPRLASTRAPRRCCTRPRARSSWPRQLRPRLDARRVGPARPLRRLLARLPGRRARARRRGGARRSTRSRPAACAPDRTLLLRIDPDGPARAARAAAARRRTASRRAATRSSPTIAAAYDALAAARARSASACIDASRSRPRRVLAALARFRPSGVAVRVGLVPGPGVGDHRLDLRLARRPSRAPRRTFAEAATSIGGSPGRRSSSTASIVAAGDRARGLDHLAHGEAVAVAEVEDLVLARARSRRARGCARRRGPRRGCSRGPRCRPASGSRCRRSRRARAARPRRAGRAGSGASRARGPRRAGRWRPATLK